ERVEVDESACLELRHLRVLHRGDLPQSRAGHAEMPGKRTAEGDGGAPPQLRGVPLPHHSRCPVVALPAETRTHLVVAVVIDLVTDEQPTVRAGLRILPRSA